MARKNDSARPGAPWLCHYCHVAAAPTRDHIVPRARAGKDIAWNIVRACRKCNAKKADDMPTCECDWCQAALFRWLSGQRKVLVPRRYPVPGMRTFKRDLAP